MKKSLLILALLTAGFARPAAAQNGARIGVLQDAMGRAVPSATITVCAYNVGSYSLISGYWTYTGPVPCTPAVTIFADPAGANVITPPLLSSGNGNYAYWAPPGNYTECAQGAQINGACYLVQVGGAGGIVAGSAGQVELNAGGNPAALGVIAGFGWDSFSSPAVLNVPGNLSATGFLNATLGLSLNLAAPVGHCLIGNGTFYVDSATCGTSGGSPGGSQFATQTNNGSGGFAGINSPGAQGFWFYTSTLPCGTTSAVSPAFVLGGLATRDVQGSTSTDTILCSDQIVNYTSSASTVAVTLPTPTALGNAHFAAKLINSSATSGAQVLVGPSGGLTINGASAWPIQQGQSCSLYVDVSGNWGLDCHEPQISLSTGMSGVRSAFGFQLQSSGNLVPQVDGANLVLGAGSVMNFIDAVAFNGLTFTFTLPSPGSGNIQPAIGGTLGNAGLTHSTFTVNGVNTCALGAACVVPPLIVIPNCATGGTSSQLLVKQVDNGSGVACAVTAATTDTSGVIGTCFSGCGTTGSAQVQNGGIAQCIFSNNATDLDYVQISTATAGNCVDAGASRPGSGQILGRVQKTASAGSINVLFVPTI